MALAAIEQLIKNTTGMDFQVVGVDSLQLFVRRRMNEIGVPSTDDYLSVIKESPQELQCLVNLVTIPETWFFRDQEPFNYLKNYVERYWLTEDKPGQLSILSLPCSTGEEPYSIAMALFDLGVNSDKLHIDAFDINNNSLSKAKNALYRDNSFRGDDLEFRSKYFNSVGGGYKLISPIVDSVNFYHGNAMNILQATSGRLYNIIFCRNLLIYYDKPAQKKLLTQLKKLLMSEGRLFLGHAEASELVMDDFENVGGNGSFAYRRRPVDLQMEGRSFPEDGNYSVLDHVGKSDTLGHRTYEGDRFPLSSKPRAIKPVDNSLIQDIERKANNGDLAEAERLCTLLVEQGIDDANSLCLCGVISEARGEGVRARELFKKAIDANPNHYEATVHLAENLESRGLSAEASLLRMRAKAIARKNISDE